MKKFICVFMSLVLMMLFVSCDFRKLKDTSIEETEVHFNTYLEHVKSYLKQNSIDYYYYYYFEDGYGTINIFFDNGEVNNNIYIRLYNDSNRERYYVQSQIHYKDINNILNIKKIEYELLYIVFSHITENTVTKDEFYYSLLQIKNNLNIPYYDTTETQWHLTNCSLDVNDVHIRYELSYFPREDFKYTETLIFGGDAYQNYPKYTYQD